MRTYVKSWPKDPEFHLKRQGRFSKDQELFRKDNGLLGKEQELFLVGSNKEVFL